MAAAETFQATSGDITKTITVPNPDGLPREQLAPLAAQAFHEYLKTSAPPAPAAAPPTSSEPDTSLGSAFRSGVSSAVQGIGASMRQAGNVLPGAAGAFLRDNAGTVANSVAPPAANFSAPGPEAAQALREGRYLDAAKALPRLGVEALPQMGAVVGGGAIGSLAGPAGAFAGAGAVSLGLNAGRDIEDIARSNHEDPNAPSGASVAKGLGLAVPKAALDAFGARGAGSLIEAIPSAVGRTGARAVREGVTQAGMDALDQGVKTGAVDPYQSAVAGVAGAAGRAMGEAPHLASAGVTGAARAATDYAMSRWGVDAPKTPEEAASLQRVVAQVEQLRQNASESGSAIGDAKLLNNLRTDLDAAVGGLFRQLRDRGFITRDEWRETFVPAYEKARRHTNSLLPDDPAFARLDDTALPPAEIDRVKTLLTDLNTAADAHYAKTSSGPLEKAGKLVGAATSLGSGIATGNPYTIGASLVGSVPGSFIGGKLGRMADVALGLQRPDILARARSADRNFGAYEGPSIGENVLGLREQLNDRYSGLYDAYGFSPEAVRAKAEAATAANTFDPANTADMNAKSPAVRAQIIRNAEADNAAMDAASRARAAEEERGRANSENAGRFLEQSLIKGAKKTIAGRQKMALEAASDATAQLRETERNAAEVSLADKAKAAQEEAAIKQNKTLKAAEAAAAEAKDRSFSRAEQDAATKKSAEEAAAWKGSQTPEEGPNVTNAQIAGHMADRRAIAAASKARLRDLEQAAAVKARTDDAVAAGVDRARRKEQRAAAQRFDRLASEAENAAKIDLRQRERATTLNERAADRVSGMAFKVSRKTAADRLKSFERATTAGELAAERAAKIEKKSKETALEKAIRLGEKAAGADAAARERVAERVSEGVARARRKEAATSAASFERSAAAAERAAGAARREQDRTADRTAEGVGRARRKEASRRLSALEKAVTIAETAAARQNRAERSSFSRHTQAAERAAGSDRVKRSRALENALTLTERAADQVSGMAYRSPEAREARADGIVGAAATTGRDALGNTRDTIPVNVPVRQKADGSYEKIGGDVPSRRRDRGGRSQADGSPQRVNADNSAAPEAPANYGARVDGKFSAGHMRYAQTAANEHLALAGQAPVTRSELEAATRHIGENGTLGDITGDPASAKEFAAFLLTHQHPIKDHPMIPAIGQAIAAQVLGNRGLGDSLWQGTRGPREALEARLGPGRSGSSKSNDVDANGNPIRSRPAYDNAGTTYHTHMRAIAEEARSKGYPRLSQVVDQIAAEPTTLGKITIRDRYENELSRLKTKDNKAELSLAKTLLSARGLAMKGHQPKRKS